MHIIEKFLVPQPIKHKMTIYTCGGKLQMRCVDLLMEVKISFLIDLETLSGLNFMQLRSTNVLSYAIGY